MQTAIVATIAALAVAAPGGAQKARPAPKSSTAVAATGGGQAIRIGKTVVVRPFGAELVDRLALVGSYRLRGRAVHLVRGDAGGACPSRFVFVSEQPGAAPVASSPFGTCSGDARVSASASTLVVAMTAAGGGPVARFVFDGGSVRTLEGAASSAGLAVAPSCLPASRVDATLQADAIATFERDFPLDYREPGRLKKVDIAPETLRAWVAELACLAPWPAAEQRVLHVATPLFASRRHGSAAFAALDSIARDPASNAHLRAVARSFAAEMTFRVERRRSL